MTGLLAAAPRPAAALSGLSATASSSAAGGDPSAAVVAGAALLAWALTGWLALTVLLTAASHLPGLTGRAARRAVACAAPAALRRSVALALGLTVASGVGAAGPSAAACTDDGRRTPPAATAAELPSLDWPRVDGPRDQPRERPALDRVPRDRPALDPSGRAPAPAAEQPQPSAGEVVVVRGDTLWAIASRSLGAGAEPAETARAWPAWWAANRDVLGDDPHLLRPGDRLRAPRTA